MSEPIDPAQRLAPVGRSRWHLPRRLGWPALVAVLGVKLWVCRGREPECTIAAARTMSDALVVVVCQQDYARTGTPLSGALLADAQRRSGNTSVATAIANGLLVTSARGDGFEILGKIAAQEERLDAALAALEQAHDLHRDHADHTGVARVDQAIAGVRERRYQHAAALRVLAECSAEARLGHDPLIEGYCHLSTAKVLVQVGTYDSAHEEDDLAIALFQRLPVNDRELAVVESQLGDREQEAERGPLSAPHARMAIIHFERARAAAQRAGMTALVIADDLNLAYSLIEDHQLEEATRWLAEADLLDRNNDHGYERTQRRAELAERRGDLARAAAIYDRLYREATDLDDRLDIAVASARIALATSALDRAERWARSGIAEAEQIAAHETEPAQRETLLAIRRAPYELLFLALARGRRIEDAVQAFDQWQGRSLRDAMIQPPAAAFDLRQTAERVESLQLWRPAVVNAPLLQTEPARLVIAQLRATDALALVIAGGELWRITSGAGQLDLRDLGALAELQPMLDALERAPTDPALATQLGQRLIPDAVFRATHDTLRVVLDKPLIALPIAALRHGGLPLIAQRPIIYAPRISQLACVPPAPRPHPVVVLADALGDLPDARVEADEVAHQLGATAAVGAAATTTALMSAGSGSLLHVAVHGDVDASGGFLALHDQRLHALDILARHAAPALVVLSACVSARSNDAELAGSLADAFVAAGATQVVATLHAVPDPTARALFAAFYRAGGDRDPARALANAQAALARTSDPDWPSFAVFGQELCSTPP